MSMLLLATTILSKRIGNIFQQRIIIAIRGIGLQLKLERYLLWNVMLLEKQDLIDLMSVLLYLIMGYRLVGFHFYYFPLNGHSSKME